MRAVRNLGGILLTFGLAWWAAYHLAEYMSDALLITFGKAVSLIYAVPAALTTLLLKEVQSLDPKDVLSEFGLNRLRRAQEIAYLRLWLLIGLHAVGVIVGGLSSFSDLPALMFVRRYGVVLEIALLVALVVVCLVYLPRLFFDLQKTRNTLADMIRSSDSRKKQIEALIASSAKNGPAVAGASGPGSEIVGPTGAAGPTPG